jgi:hypothetical protein
MQTVRPQDRVTDGDRHGRVAYVIPGDRRGLDGGTLCEARVEWDNGEWSFECIDDLWPEQANDGGIKA